MKKMTILSSLLLLSCDVVPNYRLMNADPPTLHSFYPISGVTFGGTMLKITGTNFDATMKVLVDNVPATEVTLVDSTTLTAKTPKACGPGRTVSVGIADQNNKILADSGSMTYQYVKSNLSFTSKPVAFGTNHNGMSAAGLAIGSLNPAMQITDVAAVSTNDPYVQVCSGISTAASCDAAIAQNSMPQGADIVAFGNFSDSVTRSKQDIFFLKKNYFGTFGCVETYNSQTGFNSPCLQAPLGSSIVDAAVDGFVKNGNSGIAVLSLNNLTMWVKPMGLDTPFSMASSTAPDSTYINSAIDSGDLDGNGSPDVVVASMSAATGPTRLSAFLINDDGSIKQQMDMAIGQRGRIAKVKIIPPKINGNMYPDIAVITDLGELYIGTVTTPGTPNSSISRISTSTLFSPNIMSVADFDCDGSQDIFVQTVKMGPAIYSSSQTPYAALSGVPMDPTIAMASAVAGDLNNDGKPDIVFSIPSTGGVPVLTVWLNNSTAM